MSNTQVQGVVSKIYPMGGRAAGKGQNIMVNGQKYADWEMKPVSEGMEVSFTAESKQNGQYTNHSVVKGTLVIGGGAPTASAPVANTAPTAPAKRAYIPDDEKQKLIVAQNSMTNATNLAVALIKADKLPVKEADITSYVMEQASVLAKKVMSGELYAEPEFENAPASTFDDSDVPF